MRASNTFLPALLSLLTLVSLSNTAALAAPAQNSYANSMNDLTRQANEKQTRITNGYNRAQNKSADAMNFSANIRANADTHAANMANRTDYWGRPVYSQATIDELHDRRYAKAANVQSALDSEANQIADTADRKAAAVREQALNIQQQIQEGAQSSNSQFRMVPQGTNLYVQNFAPTPSKSITPLKAVPKQLR